VDWQNAMGISIFFYLLRLALCPKIWSVLENVPWAAESTFGVYMLAMLSPLDVSFINMKWPSLSLMTNFCLKSILFMYIYIW
jgi:hypothetical protein